MRIGIGLDAEALHTLTNLNGDSVTANHLVEEMGYSELLNERRGRLVLSSALHTPYASVLGVLRDGSQYTRSE